MVKVNRVSPTIIKFIPPIFLIYGVPSIAIGLYTSFKPRETSKTEELAESKEIPVKTDQSISNEILETPDNSIRQSKAQIIKMKIKNEEEKPEVIVVPKEEKKPVAIAIPKEENKLENQSKEVISFFWGGGFGPLGWMKNKILSKEQVVEKWSILIQNGNGEAEKILKSTEFFLKDSKAPNLRIERRKMMPGFIRGMFGTKREFLVVADKNFKLKPYQIFINARDYGDNLDVSWYMTYRLPFWRAFVYFFIPGAGGRFAGPDGLDLFDQQDLTAYLTVCHHSTLDAVQNLMLGLGQDTSKIDRKSRGFFGIS